MGEEIKNPEKVIPRAMIFGPIVVMSIYLLLGFIFIALLPFENLQTGKDPFFIIGKYFLHNLLQIESPIFVEWIPRIMTSSSKNKYSRTWNLDAICLGSLYDFICE